MSQQNISWTGFEGSFGAETNNAVPGAAFFNFDSAELIITG